MAASGRTIEPQDSVAVFGESPFAAFLAGLLAGEHGRTVVLVGPPPSPLRLPRGPSLSFAPHLRTASWTLSRDTAPETLKLLARIGPKISGHTDLVLGAQGSAQSDALEHVRHLAAGFGHMIEPAVPAPKGFDSAYHVRDIHRLHASAFWAAVPDWLARHGVVRIPPDTPLGFRRSTISKVGGYDVDHVVFADAAAASAHCAPGTLDAIAHRIPMTALRTEPVAPCIDPVVMAIDGSFTQTQTGENALDIVAVGAAADAMRRAGAHLPDPGGVRLAAQAPFETLCSRDGAPLIGFLRQTRAILLAGLGPQAVFLAPAIARFLTGAASRAEQDWCEAHHPNRDFTRSRVTAFIPAQPELAP